MTSLKIHWHQWARARQHLGYLLPPASHLKAIQDSHPVFLVRRSRHRTVSKATPADARPDRVFLPADRRDLSRVRGLVPAIQEVPVEVILPVDRRVRNRTRKSAPAIQELPVEVILPVDLQDLSKTQEPLPLIPVPKGRRPSPACKVLEPERATRQEDLQDLSKVAE